MIKIHIHKTPALWGLSLTIFGKRLEILLWH